MKLTRRTLTMTSLVLAGETIYTLPYTLRRDYQKPLIRATGLSNTRLGSVSSALGVLAMICYFPGGWLADRFSARRLLSFSVLATGLSGIYLAGFPGYAGLLALFSFWGVVTILTFWAALIKATRAWGGEEQQGRAFGILDGGRGLVNAALASVGLLLFANHVDRIAGLRMVILLYTGAAIVAAVMVWLAVPDTVSAPKSTAAGRPRGQITAVLRMPAVWLQGLVIFAAYSAYWGTFDLAAYAVDAYGVDEVFGASLSTVGAWTRPISAVGAGLLADRFGAKQVVAGCFAAVATGFALFVFAPVGSLWILWANSVVLCSAIYALRGVYFALLEDTNIPVSLTGTAVGMVSIIGYTPDIINPLVSGYLLDAYPGAAGHQYYFSMLAVLAVLGCFTAVALQHFAVSPEDAGGQLVED